MPVLHSTFTGNHVIDVIGDGVTGMLPLWVYVEGTEEGVTCGQMIERGSPQPDTGVFKLVTLNSDFYQYQYRTNKRLVTQGSQGYNGNSL